MNQRFEIRIASDSGFFELSDKGNKLYVIEIWPKRSAEYFANLLIDGADKREDVEVKVTGLGRRSLHEAVCQVALFDGYGLFKCDTPNTGESRNLEIFPKDFAVWLAKCLEFRPMTKVTYQNFSS